MVPQRTGIVGKVALLGGSIVISLLFAEGVLRIGGYSSPSFHTIDADLGSALRPYAEGTWVQEGRAYVRINSDGLRDIEHQITKPFGTVRIAVLGDSYAEGLQLPIEKLFWKILENRVSSCFEGGQSAEVINFGVSGYGTGRELLILRKKVWKYDPDIVILAFLTGNDVRDNSKTLNQIDYIPYFTLVDGELVLDKSYLDTGAFRARQGWFAEFVYRYINRVRLLQLANQVRQRWHLRQQIARQRTVEGMQAGEPGLDDMIYREPETPVWQEAWRITEALILQIDAEVRARGTHLLVTTLSNGIQVDPGPVKRQRFMQQLGIRDLFYPDRRVVDLAKRHAIHALMLAPRLQEWAEKHNTCVHGFPNSGLCGGHWNEHAHRLAGEWIADKICKDLLG